MVPTIFSPTPGQSSFLHLVRCLLTMLDSSQSSWPSPTCSFHLVPSPGEKKGKRCQPTCSFFALSQLPSLGETAVSLEHARTSADLSQMGEMQYPQHFPRALLLLIIFQTVVYLVMTGVVMRSLGEVSILSAGSRV